LRDRDLVRLYWPVELRPAFDALFDIDDAMADVVVRSTQPALGAIKLAWWRERLEELDEGKVPAEPRLQAVVAELLPRGVVGAELAQMESGWAALLDEHPDLGQASRTGEKLFELLAKLAGESDSTLAAAGRLYMRQRLVRRGLAPGVEVGSEFAAHVFARRLRPVTALAALAARDARRGRWVEPEATPGRALALLRHRLTGRV